MQQGQIDEEVQNPVDLRNKPTKKKKDIIAMMKSNPTRLKYLRDSLKAFTPIKKNIYLDRKRKNPKNDDLECCWCKPKYQDSKSPQHTNVSYNCQERCLNRMISTQCDDQTCRCFQLCANRKFQKHDYAFVYPFPAGGKGWGLCAGQHIKRGQFIMQYIGEIFSIHSQVGKARIKQYSKSACTYLMKTSKGEVIDPTTKGSLARFINHSCDPNCITQKWNVLGQICIGIFSLRDIEEDEELTFDYQFDVYSTPLTKCLCGTKKCKGYLGLRPTDITAEEWNERLEDMTCQICFKNYQDDDQKLIICDQCNRGFHIYCLDPPIHEIPEEAFFCKKCELAKQIDKQEGEQRERQLINMKIKRVAEEKQMIVQDSSSDELPFNEDYEKIFRFIKKQENIVVKELQAIVKKDQASRKPQMTPQKRKIEQVNPSTPVNRKKDQFYQLHKKAIDKFQSYLQKNPKIIQSINNFGQRKQKTAKAQKKTILLNKIQMHLILRNNFILFEKIGAQIYFDTNSRNSTDFFLKSTQVSIIGSSEQIMMLEQIVAITNEIINQLQVEMGITEAYIPVPAILVRRLVGHGHSIINQIQKNNQVAIYYHRRFLNEECYTLQVQSKMLIKGGKQNILKAYEQIKKRLQALQVQRLYLNPYQIKTVVNNMPILKRKTGMAQFRINRQPPFKQVNHPFYYIQQKNKQIAIIGTRSQIQKTRKEILSFFEEPNRKEQFNFNISLFLAQPNHKSQLLSVKGNLQKQIPSIRMMIFDPTPPRKNMTLSFLGTRENRHKARQYLFRKLQQLGRQGKVPVNLQHFQDQMNYQMTKYYFKYMQNTLLTKDTAFMKSWDILNPYFCEQDDNYMWKSVKKQLSNDYQTLLYACFVLKDKIILKMQRQSNSKLSIIQQVYELIKNNINRILNIYNVNNTSGLKNYLSDIDHQEAKRLFRDIFPHVTFLKPQEKKTTELLQQPNKERQMSFFQRKVFKKYKNLFILLEEQRKRSRQKDDDRKKWK